MEFRSDLTVSLAKIIRAGQLTHADIAKRAGASRTRVTAIANGNIQGVSTDVLIRVFAATGRRASRQEIGRLGHPLRHPHHRRFTSRVFIQPVPFSSSRPWHYINLCVA